MIEKILSKLTFFTFFVCQLKAICHVLGNILLSNNTIASLNAWKCSFQAFKYVTFKTFPRTPTGGGGLTATGLKAISCYCKEVFSNKRKQYFYILLFNPFGNSSRREMDTLDKYKLLVLKAINSIPTEKRKRPRKLEIHDFLRKYDNILDEEFIDELMHNMISKGINYNVR